MRRLHAAGVKLGLDHAALRSAMQAALPGTKSLGDLSERKLRQFAEMLETRAQPQKPKRQAPRGKRRPDGVVPMATDKQRRFLTSLLHQAFGMLGWQSVVEADKFARRVLGDRLLCLERVRIRDVVAQVTTASDASVLINSAIAELKSRGLWRENRRRST